MAQGSTETRSPSPSVTDAQALERLLAEVRRALETPGLTVGQRQAIARLAEAAAHAVRRERVEADRRRLADLVDAQARMLVDLKATAERRSRMLDGALWSARSGLWECRLSDERLDWTPGVYDLFGFPVGSRLHRQDTLALYAPASLEALETARGEALRHGGRFSLDAEITTNKGARRWIRLSGVVEREHGRAARLYGLKRDVTEERAEADHARRLAEVDPLTGLSNRRLFDERLGELARVKGCALLLIDLDGFKSVNDTLGHSRGDACIQEAARRLNAVCRAAALVARIGGDEFAVLIEDGAVADRVARCVVGALHLSLERDGARIGVGASVGVARSDGGGATAWFRRADAALYAAKRSGRGTFRVFTPDLGDDEAATRLAG